MYCKNCGKEIDDDSKFCRYCGTKLEPDVSLDTPQEPQKVVVEDVVKAKVEVFDGHKEEKEEKKQQKKSGLANEIVAIAKIIGIAYILWFLAFMGFEVYHSKDIKQHPKSYWGESCYDESTTGNYILNDEDAEQMLTHLVWDERNRNGIHTNKCVIKRNGWNEPDFQHHWQILQQNDSLKKAWINEKVEEGRTEFSKDINSNRMYAHERNRSEWMKWSAIIILFTLILGRYIWKVIKWTSANRTE